MLEDYAEKHGFSNIRHFTDDGWSGGNFDRPDWKKLIAEIEAGNVATVICKDMSRIGRDYLQVGFYTEVMFREKGVRFISISNSIDSANRDSGEFAPFLNIMSEWYCSDISSAKSFSSQYSSSESTPTQSATSSNSAALAGSTNKSDRESTAMNAAIIFFMLASPLKTG